MAIGLSHGGTTIYSNATASKQILVGTPGTWCNPYFAGARISCSKDGGRSWDILKNGLPDRLQASIDAFCLEEAGAATSIYAATTAGEIFCSADLGDSWKVIVKGLAPISKAGHYRALVQAA